MSKLAYLFGKIEAARQILDSISGGSDIAEIEDKLIEEIESIFEKEIPALINRSDDSEILVNISPNNTRTIKIMKVIS